MQIKQVSLLLCAILLTTSVSPNSFVTTVGFEIELTSDFAQGNPNFSGSEIRRQVHLKKLKKAAKIIKQTIGDTRSGNHLTVKDWEKHPRYNLKEIIYIDHLNRTWIIEPEWVNFPRPDGVEIVSPGLEDPTIIQKLYKNLLIDPSFGIGRRSSVQTTFSVEKLIKSNGNCSKLVDLILYLENNADKIFASIGPMRYGTIVNRFAVPLGADHPELLKELAALSKRDRTISNVKAIFKDYYQKEKEIWELTSERRAKDKAFKYRAFNYKKIFGLGGVEKAPLLEVRIQDAVDPKIFKKNTEYLTKLMERGTRNRITSFKNPWGRKRKPSEIKHHNFKRLNKRIYNVSKASFKEHLDSVGVPRKDKLVELRGEFQLVPKEARLIELRESVDFSNEILIKGKPLSVGFELEFRPNDNDQLFKNNSNKFKREFRQFMDRDIDVEDTGNKEVRSLPTTILDDNFDQMRRIKQSVMEPRGFHLHLRFSKKIINDIGRNNFDGWITRMSDTILGWRLENRKTFFALNVSTQARLILDEVDDRGTMRVTSMNIERSGMIDLEIRGFMTDINEMEKFTTTIITGLKNPKYVSGMAKYQELLYRDRHDILKKSMKKFVKKFYNRKLTSLELDTIQSVMYNAIDDPSVVLPLQGFEHAPYLTTLQQKKIQNANNKFLWWVKTFVLDSPHKVNTPDLNIAFRGQVRKWAYEVDYYDLLSSSLLMKKPANFDHIISGPFLADIIKAGHLEPHEFAKIIAGSTDENLKRIIKSRFLTTTELKVVMEAIMYIEGKEKLKEFAKPYIAKGNRKCINAFRAFLR